MKPRSTDDPNVREVMAAFEDVAAYAHEDARRHGRDRAEVFEGAAHTFVFDGVIGPHTFDHWPDEALRAIVLAFAQHAPAEDFEALVGRVRLQRAWVDEWRKEDEAGGAA